MPETRTVEVALVPDPATPPVDDVQDALKSVIAEPFVAPAVTETSTQEVLVPTV
jgi:hypothetical protein